MQGEPELVEIGQFELARFSNPGGLNPVGGNLFHTGNQYAHLASSGNHVYAVWEDVNAGLGDIHFARSTDHGQTWLTPTRLDTDPPGAALFSAGPITIS